MSDRGGGSGSEAPTSTSPSQPLPQPQPNRRTMNGFVGGSSSGRRRDSNNGTSNSYNPGNPNYNGTNTQYGLPDYGNTNYGHDCSGVNIDRRDLIDSALIAALRDPKERDALLHLETALVQFMHSPAGWVEVSGPYNSLFWTGGDPPVNMKRERHSSFQRCVLHRLADRFWIIREPGQLVGALRLIKVPNSAVPPVLLNDLSQIEVAEALSRINMAPLPTNPSPPQPRSPQSSLLITASSAAPVASSSPFFFPTTNTNIIISTNTNTSAITTTTAEPPTTTMKIIMKRTNSQATSMEDDDRFGPNGTNNGNINSNKAPTSISDKEKAYAAARARIFNEPPLITTEIIEPTAAVSTTSSGSSAAAAAAAAAARTKLTAGAPAFVPNQPVSSTSTTTLSSSLWLKGGMDSEPS